MLRRIYSLLAALCLFTGGCSLSAQAEAEKRTYYFFDTFDTMITVMGYTEDQATFDRVCQEVQQQFTAYHQLFDAYNEYPGVQNIYTLNRDAGKAPVQVTPALMDMLLFAKAWQPKLEDTVNIAMGSVLQIWHDYRTKGIEDPENAALPPMETLKAAAEHTNFDSIQLDAEAGTVFFTDPQVQLDVGALAKGYATEKVAQWMLTSEMPHFILNAGGNVRTGLPPLDGRKNWGVSLQNPDAALSVTAPDQTIETLYLSDLSVVTSGDYQRFYIVDGVRYHHIIAPDTLMPADTHRAVSIVCQDSALADMLSTALFILPYTEGRTLVESLDGVEALWVEMDGSVIMTDGLYAQSKSGGATSK